MPIDRLDHYSVRARDVKVTRDFYVDIVGLSDGYRPDFPFPGAWLYAGDRAVVHLIGVDPGDSTGLTDYLGDKADAAEGSGNLDHVAFVASGFDAMRARFQELGAKFHEREVPGLKLRQVFLTDPNGVVVELNFPG